MKIQVLEFYAVSAGKLLQTFSFFCSQWTAWHWRWRHHASLKHWQVFTSQCSLISQKFKFSCLHWDCTSFTTC